MARTVIHQSQASCVSPSTQNQNVTLTWKFHCENSDQAVTNFRPDVFPNVFNVTQSVGIVIRGAPCVTVFDHWISNTLRLEF
ncbi:hypothetical protein J6590_036462 [Homalodisca vitripennis]|nr:hypothetical protein J6590_036462 [Homalodisca vitripennis]